MVLSNKKLKQKLREAKAGLLSANVESFVQNPNSKKSQETVKSLLDSAAQKAKSSKTKTRKRKALSLKENGGGSEGVSNGDEEMEGKFKKMKRGDGEKGVEVEEKEEMKEKKMKMKKNKKKKKRKAKSKENKKAKSVVEGAEEIGANGNEVSENHTVQETNRIIEETNQAANNEASLDEGMKVYVGGIPYYSTEDDIRSFFESCGTITEIDCMTFPESGKFRGIAIITFRTEAAAKRALALDGSDMGGLFLKIQPYKSGRTTVKAPGFSPAVVEGYNRIYVGNLSWDITEDDLKKTFSNCNIKSIRLGVDKETGEFRGYAHVDFSDSESLNNALKLDQTVVLGRPVKISAAVLKKASDKKSESTGKSNLSVPGNESGVKSQPLSSDGKESGVQSQPLPSDGKESGVKSQPVPADFGEEENVSGKIRRRTCYECGERGHLSSACPKSSLVKEYSAAPANGGESWPMLETSAPVDGGGGVENVSGKIKRRTCYECGERGHLSSACPKSALVKQSEPKLDSALISFGVKSHSQPMPEAATLISFGGEENVSGKIRRRTCYECGERGHLSSACPKSAPAKESEPQLDRALAAHSFESHSQPKPVTSASVSFGGEENVSGKIRRRTCYECGERGHLSSACPNLEAQKAKLSNTGGAAAPMEGVESQPMPNTVAPVDGGSEVASGKIRRRTCYECGERGHLSSACPKKLSSDQTVSVSS